MGNLMIYSNDKFGDIIWKGNITCQVSMFLELNKYIFLNKVWFFIFLWVLNKIKIIQECPTILTTFSTYS